MFPYVVVFLYHQPGFPRYGAAEHLTERMALAHARAFAWGGYKTILPHFHYYSNSAVGAILGRRDCENLKGSGVSAAGWTGTVHRASRDALCQPQGGSRE